MSIVATPEPGNLPPRVELAVDWAGHDEAFVTRLDPDGRERPVRLGEPAELVDGEWLGYDYEAPFGSPVTYAIRDGEDEELSDAVSLDVDEVWLRHPTVPELSVVPPIVRPPSFGEEEWAVNEGVFYPLGRSTPIVVTDEARKSSASTLVVGTETLEQLEQMRALLADSRVLLLSVPPSWRWGVTHQYIHVRNVTVTRRVDIGDAEARDFTMPYLVVGRPAGGVQAQWTWADVLTEFASWADEQATFEAWADLLSNDRGV